MNKTSLVFIFAGLVVLAALIIFILPKNRSQPLSPASPAAPPTASPSPSVQEIIFEYKQNNPAEPKSVRVQEGQRVIVRVNSDLTDKVHLHGYDLSSKVSVDSPATLEFTTDKTGSFELELEDSKKTLSAIEVYPK